MGRNVPHVYAEVTDVAERVALFRRAPEAERLAAVAVLTKRQVSHSGAFAATMAALVVAGLVGALGAYTTYVSLISQGVVEQREAAVELARLFAEKGMQDQEMVAHALARDSLDLIAQSAELVPGTLMVLACATALTLMWAWWRTRQGSIASAWLAVYQTEKPASATPEPAPVRRGRRRLGLLEVLTRRRR